MAVRPKIGSAVKVKGMRNLMEQLDKIKDPRNLADIQARAMRRFRAEAVKKAKVNVPVGEKGTFGRGALKKSIGALVRKYNKSGSAVMVFGSFTKSRFRGLDGNYKYPGGGYPSGKKGGYYAKREEKDGFMKRFATKTTPWFIARVTQNMRSEFDRFWAKKLAKNAGRKFK